MQTESYYTFLERLRTIANKCLTNHSEPKSEKEALLLFAIGKADKTLNSIALLCQRGMGEDAAMLCRSIMELSVIVKYILADRTDYLAKKYFSFDWIQRGKMMKYLEEKSIIDLNCSEELKNIKNQIESAKLQFEYKNNRWSFIKEMFESVEQKDLYDTVYSIQSSLIHSSPRSMNEYFLEENGRLILNSGPSNNLVNQTLVTACNSYLELIKQFNAYFAKGYNIEIQTIEDDFIKQIQSELNK